MKSNVVIGGGGFIGRHLVREIIKLNEEVTIVARNQLSFDNVDKEIGAVKTKQIDLKLCTPADFDEIIGNHQIIHHCVWTTIPAIANIDPIQDVQDNLHMHPQWFT